MENNRKVGNKNNRTIEIITIHEMQIIKECKEEREQEAI